MYVTPSGSGNWAVVFGGWAAWTAAVPLWRSAVRAPDLTALGEKGTVVLSVSYKVNECQAVMCLLYAHCVWYKPF